MAATCIFYTGDTWPPLTGTIRNASGIAQSLASAASFRTVSKMSGATPVIQGAATYCPTAFGGTGNGSDGKWAYFWAADDLALAGSYVPEVEVTWDAASTPARIETFRDSTEFFVVLADND